MPNPERISPLELMNENNKSRVVKYAMYRAMIDREENEAQRKVDDLSQAKVSSAAQKSINYFGNSLAAQ